MTEPLFEEFPDYLDRLERAANMAGGDALVPKEIVQKLKDWHAGRTDGTLFLGEQLTAPDGELVVFEPGSLVSVRIAGTLIERELLEPRLFDFGDTKMLMYRI